MDFLYFLQFVLLDLVYLVVRDVVVIFRFYVYFFIMYQVFIMSYFYYNFNFCNMVFFWIMVVNQYGMKGFFVFYLVYGQFYYQLLILNLMEFRIFKGDCVVNKLVIGFILNLKILFLKL